MQNLALATATLSVLIQISFTLYAIANHYILVGLLVNVLCVVMYSASWILFKTNKKIDNKVKILEWERLN